MSKCAMGVVVVLLAVGSWYGLRAQPPTTGPAPEAAPQNPFAGKALMITVKSDPDWMTCIENPSVQHVGGKDFVVGTCFQGGDDDEWRIGLTIWTAMDDISQITEAHDVETLKKKMQETAEEDTKPTRA